MEEFFNLRWSEETGAKLRQCDAGTSTWGTYALLRAFEPDYCIYQQEFVELDAQGQPQTSIKKMFALETNTSVKILWMPVSRWLWDPNSIPFAKVMDEGEDTPL
jgi:hypothetical protein